MSLIRQLHTWCFVFSLVIGFPLNIVLIRLISRHTPKLMRVYSKILLQTCFTDLALLFMTALVDPIFFSTGGGQYANNFLNGVFTLKTPNDRIWGILFYSLWVFLVYLSLFGFVSQFIYRYLTLNRNLSISSCKYFGILIGISAVPAVYCVIYFYSSLPNDSIGPHSRFIDPLVAEILGFSKNELVVVITADESSPLLSLATYYIAAACSLAYALMCLLGWLMYRFVKRNLVGAKNNQKVAMELNRKLIMLLSIQAGLAVTIYAPLLFLLVGIILQVPSYSWTPYYSMTCGIPMYLPAVLDPLITILMVKDYRTVFFSRIKIAFISFGVAFSALFCCKQQQITQESHGTQKTIDIASRSRVFPNGNRVMNMNTSPHQ